MIATDRFKGEGGGGGGGGEKGLNVRTVEHSVKSFLIFLVDKINEVLDKLQPNFEVQVVFL